MTLTIARHRWLILNPEILALVALTALCSGTDDIVWRTLPFELAVLGIPIALLGLLQSVNIAADLATELPAGAYVDRRGRKSAIVGGIMALGISVGFLAFSSTLSLIAIAVALIGVTEAFFLRGSSIRFYEAAEPATRGRGIAWSAIAGALGSFAGLLLAGAFFSHGLTVVLVALAVIALSLGLASIPFLRDIPVKDRRRAKAPVRRHYAQAVRDLRTDFAHIKDRRFLGYSVVVQVFLSLSFGSSYVFIPALGVVVGLNPTDILLLFAAMRLASVALAYAGGWLSDRYRQEWFFIGRPLSALALATVLALAVTPVVFLVGVFAIAGLSFTSPGYSAYFLGRFEEGERGKAGGVNTFFTSSVGVAAPLLGGLLWVAAPNLVYVFAALVSLPGVLAGVVATRVPRVVRSA